MKLTASTWMVVLGSMTSQLVFGAGEPYYYLGNKGVGPADFSPAVRQQLYEVELERYQKIEQVIDQVVLEQQLTKRAEQEKKPRATLEAELFKTEVSEKEAEAWFNENKAMIPGRDFASIKGELIPYLTRIKQDKIRKELVAGIKNDRNYRLAIAKPEAPVITISTTGHPHKGSNSPKVTIVEFADYRCPHCKVASGVLKNVVEKYADKVAFYFIDFPLHDTAVAEGAVCAHEQQKFWEYHYEAFAQQETLNASSPGEIAKKLGLDPTKFSACLTRPTTKEKVNLAKQEGVRIGVTGTPAIYLNGKKHMGYSEDELVKAVQSML